LAALNSGDSLRLERLRQGLTLCDIVQRTRIPIASLEAIEANEFDRLPGLVFVRGFVRTYATQLNLDPEPLLAGLPRINLDTVPLPNPPGLAPPRWDPRVTAALASVLWVVAVVGAGTAAWYYFDHHGQRRVTTVMAAPAPKPVVTDEGARQETAVPEPTAIDADSFDGSRPVQVILTAREAAWVQVSADGRTAFVGILHPNDTKSITADDQVKILTGNAGGLDISLNGKPLDPIGPSGQVRTVRLTAEGPQFGPKNPPASSPL
jgi:hypothetical protein